MRQPPRAKPAGVEMVPVIVRDIETFLRQSSLSVSIP